jgi:S1-C subfamily serine protease
MKHIANATDLEKAISTLNRGKRISVVFLRGSEQFVNEGII